MKKIIRGQKGFTIIELIVVIVMIFSIIGYAMNIYKLVKCDFKAPYKAEIIRGIGIVTGTGVVIGYISISDNSSK